MCKTVRIAHALSLLDNERIYLLHCLRFGLMQSLLSTKNLCLQHETILRAPAPKLWTRLIEWVVASAPVGQNQAKTNSFKDAGQGSNCHSVERALLSEDLGDKLEFSLAVSTGEENDRKNHRRLTLGAELAKKIKLPR